MSAEKELDALYQYEQLYPKLRAAIMLAKWGLEFYRQAKKDMETEDPRMKYTPVQVYRQDLEDAEVLIGTLEGK